MGEKIANSKLEVVAVKTGAATGRACTLHKVAEASVFSKNGLEPIAEPGKISGNRVQLPTH